jgi:hypothetical protein
MAPRPKQWVDVAVRATDCDDRLWKHTYAAWRRLATVSRCITVSGIARDVHMAGDGDLIIELETDPRLVNASNVNGWLKVEAVCQGRGSGRKHRSACKGYPGPRFAVPRPGMALRITGRYVADRNHGGHMEIHPVSHIEVLP